MGADASRLEAGSGRGAKLDERREIATLFRLKGLASRLTPFDRCVNSLAIPNPGRGRRRPMSALTTAQTRMGTALARLELALRPVSAADSLADTDLRAECERLRRELAAANARVERLNAALSEVESRVGRAIDQVDALTGGKVVP
jgi:hypothetical protein